MSRCTSGGPCRRGHLDEVEHRIQRIDHVLKRRRATALIDPVLCPGGKRFALEQFHRNGIALGSAAILLFNQEIRLGQRRERAEFLKVAPLVSRRAFRRGYFEKDRAALKPPRAGSRRCATGRVKHGGIGARHAALPAAAHDVERQGRHTPELGRCAILHRKAEAFALARFSCTARRSRTRLTRSIGFRRRSGRAERGGLIPCRPQQCRPRAAAIVHHVAPALPVAVFVRLTRRPSIAFSRPVLARCRAGAPTSLATRARRSVR